MVSYLGSSSLAIQGISVWLMAYNKYKKIVAHNSGISEQLANAKMHITTTCQVATHLFCHLRKDHLDMTEVDALMKPLSLLTNELDTMMARLHQTLPLSNEPRLDFILFNLSQDVDVLTGLFESENRHFLDLIAERNNCLSLASTFQPMQWANEIYEERFGKPYKDPTYLSSKCALWQPAVETSQKDKETDKNDLKLVKNKKPCLTTT